VVRGILSTLTLKSKPLLILELQKWLFPHMYFPVGIREIPSVHLAVRWLDVSPSADVGTATGFVLIDSIDSFRQLLRVSVCSLFSAAWKDIVILYAYRKRGKLSEHLLFINLASYCSNKMINEKTEAQSN